MGGKKKKNGARRIGRYPSVVRRGGGRLSPCRGVSQKGSLSAGKMVSGGGKRKIDEWPKAGLFCDHSVTGGGEGGEAVGEV